MYEVEMFPSRFYVISDAFHHKDLMTILNTIKKDTDEVLKDIENNEAIKTGNVDENAKKQFLKGADVAYEQIITSFAKGDKKSLKGLIVFLVLILFSKK